MIDDVLDNLAPDGVYCVDMYQKMGMKEEDDRFDYIGLLRYMKKQGKKYKDLTNDEIEQFCSKNDYPLKQYAIAAE